MDLNDEIKDTYDIVAEIGSGGGGIIYKAYHKRLQKYVVLKKMHSNVKKIINIRIEADILKNLHHPYLPQVMDFLTTDNNVYTVLDFIPGKSFSELLKQGYKFTLEQVLKYTKQLCEAMAYLHGHKPPILHGDIKPDNIILRPDDNICLIDFNISAFLTGANMIMAGFSAGYASPEQCIAVKELKNNFLKKDNTIDEETIILPENQKDNSREGLSADNEAIHIDQRSDVYSMGATMYHLATGIHPDIISERNREICDLIENYSQGFSNIIAKSMEKSPDKRFKDAVEMLRAVKNIHRYDRRYKLLLVKQEIAYVTLICFMGISVLMIFTGKEKIELEKTERYDVMIENLRESREGKKEEFETLFQEACTYMPERLEAYYEKALYLTETGQYEESIKFIQNNLLNGASTDSQDLKGSIYYLLANGYFELEDYEKAAVYYQMAIDNDGNKSQYYGDYAIALAYSGRIEVAEDILVQGRERGMESDYIFLISAEIASARGKYTEAIENFRKCIDITESQTIKLRAYILWDKELKSKEITEEALLKSVELLTKAETELDLSDQILILERLAQDYIDLSSVTESLDYNHKALETFKKIVQYGWDNYATHVNMAILYERAGQFIEAAEELKPLIESEPNNYIAYKRLAILEIDIQNTKSNEERDYQQFLNYYTRAVELYTDSKSGGNDLEMQWLKQTFEQLTNGGWL